MVPPAGHTTGSRYPLDCRKLRKRTVRSTNTPQFRGFYVNERFLRFPKNGPMDPSRIRFDGAPVVESSFEERESVGYGNGSERSGGERREL